MPSPGPQHRLRMHAVLRRWYVVLAVMALMVPAVLQAAGATGVYWSKVDVVFYPPSGAAAEIPCGPIRRPPSTTPRWWSGW